MSNGSVPHSLDAECAVIGSILVDAQVLLDVQMILGDGDAFFSRPHREIFRAMVAMDGRGEPAGDLLLIESYAELDGVGGLIGLGQMAEAIGHAGHAQHYARIVAAKAMQRRLISVGAKVVALSREHEGSDTSGLVEDCERAVFEVADSQEAARSHTVDAVAKATLHDLAEVMEGRGSSRLAVATGFRGLDEMTHGLHGGELAILAARPSMGKTSLGSALALNAGAAGYHVAFFSVEVNRDQLVRNWLCQRAEVSSGKLRGGGCGQDEYAQLERAADWLGEMQITINDTPAMSLVGMRTACRRLHSRQPLQLVVVDYLQLLSASSGARKESRQQEVSEISQGLKHLARMLECPVLALAQLNRGVDNREDHRPRMSDLRESGSIEQEADLIMFLYREGYYQRDDPSVRNHAELIVGKQRHGPTGAVQLTFEPSFARFSDKTDMPWTPRS